jgi:hypothetical protein
MDAVPLFLTTVGLTVGIAFLLSKGNQQQIRSQWNERRCELPVMVMAQMFKPDDDPRTSSEFAQENFEFCSRMYVKQVFTAMLTPLMMILGKQLDVTSAIGDGTNMMRTILATASNSMQAILDPFYRRYMMIGYHFAQVYKKMMSAMERVYGAMVASLYMGISMFRGVLNFKDMVVKIVLIIMGILIAAIILLFFILIPVLPVVLTTVAVLAAGGITVAGAGAFCFTPDTLVVLSDNSVQPICTVEPGKKLKGGGYVEGILLTQREANTPLYSYDGVIVSGSHMVHENHVWKFVEYSERAVPVENTTERLYSLRTSSRTMLCRNDHGKEILFRDWEEIPEGDHMTDNEWDTLVQKLLNNTMPQDTTSEHDPLFSSRCLVTMEDGKKRALHTLRIGDTIRADDQARLTTILGIYRGIGFTDTEHEAWYTDGVWWKMPDGNWHHRDPMSPKPRIQTTGVHLITDTGTFWVEITPTDCGTVRDFTEVGHHHLSECTPFLLSRLNEKPQA